MQAPYAKGLTFTRGARLFEVLDCHTTTNLAGQIIARRYIVKAGLHQCSMSQEELDAALQPSALVDPNAIPPEELAAYNEYYDNADKSYRIKPMTYPQWRDKIHYKNKHL